MPAAHRADRLAPRHRGTDRDNRGHRLVFSHHTVRVREHDHAPTGDQAGKAHPARTRGEHGLTRCGREVDAAVPG